MAYFNTCEAAKRLGISYSRLARACWENRFDLPLRGPGGVFLWDELALERASWQLLHRAYKPLLEVPLTGALG